MVALFQLISFVLIDWHFSQSLHLLGLFLEGRSRELSEQIVCDCGNDNLARTGSGAVAGSSIYGVSNERKLGLVEAYHSNHYIPMMDANFDIELFVFFYAPHNILGFVQHLDAHL